MKKTVDGEFNLLTEKWIRVMLPDCSVKEVSLTELFDHAHEYRSLAGEMPTQDFAMLRFLIAIAHTALSPEDDNGQRRAFEDADEALDFYEELWKNGRFPQKQISDYLSKWQERFWLFHPTHPFWQVPEARIGTEVSAAKLNGEISESENKQKLFAKRAGYEKKNMSNAEAARWLLHINGYDDTSAKPKRKGAPSPGTGWLGKLGGVYAEGYNLYETIVLNMVMLKDEEPWGVNKPSWELDKPRSEERIEIAMPDNQAELLSLMSRRILLKREDNLVTGYAILGGDFFQKDNAYSEQMTMWRHVSAKAKEPERDTPKRHSPDRQFWRELPTFMRAENKDRLPGIVRWISYLQSKNIRIVDNKKFITFSAVSLIYGDKDFFATESYGDNLNFHRRLLTDVGFVWRTKIVEMISLCDEAAEYIGILSDNIYHAAGGDSIKSVKREYANVLYFRLDEPFRKWLYSIDLDNSNISLEDMADNWKSELKKIALTLGKEMVNQAGVCAFVGKKVGDYHRSSPEAYNIFQIQIKKLLG